MNKQTDNIENSLENFLKKNRSSVLDFANNLKWPLEYMFSELFAAGIVKKNAYEQLSDEEQIKLLNHIVRYYQLTKKDLVKVQCIEPKPLDVGDTDKSIFDFKISSSNNLQKDKKTAISSSQAPFNKKCPFCFTVLNGAISVCEGCGTAFSNQPSLIFGDDEKEDHKYDENNF